MTDLPEALGYARERAHYSQEEVASALGVSRAMVSYWETGARKPNDRQVSAIARLYGVELIDLLTGDIFESTEADLAGMMLRSGQGIDAAAVPGIHDFIGFLKSHAELADLLGESVKGMSQSPYSSNFRKRDDARRKAEEVRAHLRLGVGPISDLEAICQMLRITLYRSPLGSDLRRSPSGAFLNHPEVGFSILVNLDMTPGRRRFTAAHELAHALFHSGEDPFVISQGKGSKERFADDFAAEFLMPAEGVRRFMEDLGMPSKIEEAIDAIHIQRYFRVSWVTALFRMRSIGVMTSDTFAKLLREVRPVVFAKSLGYVIDPEEYEQDPNLWRIRRFPRSFIHMLRRAVSEEVMSVPSAASLAGVTIHDITKILGYIADEPDAEEGELRNAEVEFKEFEDSGVI